MDHHVSWGKFFAILGLAGIGGFVGGVGLAALVSAVLARRVMDSLGW